MLWGTVMNLPDPVELTVWCRRWAPPRHRLRITGVGTDQASAAGQKRGVFGQVIGVTWGDSWGTEIGRMSTRGVGREGKREGSVCDGETGGSGRIRGTTRTPRGGTA